MRAYLVAGTMLVLAQPSAAQDPDARLGRLACDAGEIAKFDGSRWVCAADDPGAEFVVRDANGNQFGMVVEFTTGFIRGVRTAEVIEQFHSPARDDEINLAFFVTPKFIGALGVQFESADCTGTPWLSDTEQEDLFSLVEPTGMNIATGEVYAALEEPTQQVVINSSTQGVLGCQPNPPREVRAVRAELIEPNIFAIFPPPYTLELE